MVKGFPILKLDKQSDDFFLFVDELKQHDIIIQVFNVIEFS